MHRHILACWYLFNRAQRLLNDSLANKGTCQCQKRVYAVSWVGKFIMKLENSFFECGPLWQTYCSSEMSSQRFFPLSAPISHGPNEAAGPKQPIKTLYIGKRERALYEEVKGPWERPPPGPQGVKPPNGHLFLTGARGRSSTITPPASRHLAS